MRKPLLPVLLLLALPIFAARPQTLSGEAVVRTIGMNRVAVLVDTNADGSVDQGFLLSSDLPVASTTARTPGATVQYTDGYVRVTSESKVFDLYVAGYPEPPALQEKKDLSKFVGYALQHSSGTSGCNLDRAMSDAGACFGYGKE